MITNAECLNTADVSYGLSKSIQNGSILEKVVY